MRAVGRAAVPNRHLAPPVPDDPAEQLYRGAQFVIDRHGPVLVLDRPRCSWCGEGWPCSSIALAEQAQRYAMRALRGLPW